MADKFLTATAVPAATTSVSVTLYVETQAGAPVTGLAAADINASYHRQGAVRVAITEADLAAMTDAYAAGGWLEVDATNMPGLYRLDVPDAALIAGADFVVVSVLPTVTGTFKTAHVTLALPTYAALRTALFGLVVESEGSYTAQQALSVILAAVAGVTDTAGATLKTPNGAATRIAATINGSNERTAMTLTPSS